MYQTSQNYVVVIKKTIVTNINKLGKKKQINNQVILC